MTDLEQSRVLDVVADRTAEACQELWTRLGVEQSHKVEPVTIDMWEPYLSITAQAAPQAKSCMTSFMLPNTSTKQSIRCGGPRTASCIPKEAIYSMAPSMSG